jgi:hypothetical protein
MVCGGKISFPRAKNLRRRDSLVPQSEESTMVDVLPTFRPGEFIALVAVSGGLLIGLVAVIAGVWHKVRLAEMQAGLKQQMLGRGMSAAEIEQVLKSSSPPADAEPEEKPPFTGDPVADRATLVKLLAENGYEGEDIARILQAFDGPKPGTRTPESAQDRAECVGNFFQKVMQAFQGDVKKASEQFAGKR